MNRREFLSSLPGCALGIYVAGRGYLESLGNYPNLEGADELSGLDEAAGKMLPAISGEGRMEFRLADSSQWIEAKVNFPTLARTLAWAAFQTGGDDYLGLAVEFMEKVGLKVKFERGKENFAAAYAPKMNGLDYPQLWFSPNYVTSYFKGIPRGSGTTTVDGAMVHEAIHFVQDAAKPSIGVAYHEASSWVFYMGSFAAGAKVTKDLVQSVEWAPLYKNALIFISGVLSLLGTTAAEPYLDMALDPGEREAYAATDDPRFDTTLAHFDAMRGKLFDFVNL